MTETFAYPGVGLIEADRQRQQREPLQFLTLLAALFAIFALSIVRIYPWNYVVKGLGGFLAFVYLVQASRGRNWIVTELIIFAIWTAWCLLGVFGGAFAELFWTRWFTVVQMLILILVVSSSSNSRRHAKVILAAYMIGGAILGIASVTSGSWKIAAEEEGRLVGMGANPNGFGRTMVFITLCAMFFWMQPSRRIWLKRILLGSFAAVAGYAALLTGSRFSAGGLALLYLLWGWFCYRKELLRRPLFYAATILVTVVAGYFIVMQVSEMPIGARFVSAWETLHGKKTEGSTGSRLEMYKEGLDVLSTSPVVGVGLGNFWVLSKMQRPAHSDYTEVFTGTGVVGGVIYYSIYVVLWMRTGRIRKRSKDPLARQEAGLVRALILVMLFLGLGAPNYGTKYAWLILAPFIGYTAAIWHSMRAEQPEADGPRTAEGTVQPTSRPF